MHPISVSQMMLHHNDNQRVSGIDCMRAPRYASVVKHRGSNKEREILHMASVKAVRLLRLFFSAGKLQ